MILLYSENHPLSENASNIPPPSPWVKLLSWLARGLIASLPTTVPLPDQVNKEQMEAGRATIKSAQREIAA
ncbi:unnamed protein product, partial [Vitis vinifera]